MYQGYLEYIQAFRIYGWAFSADNPQQRLTVEVLCGDVVLGRATADVFRDDLRETSIGDGAHGFIFDVIQDLNEDDLQKISARIVTDEGRAVPLKRLTYTPQVQATKAEEEASPVQYPGACADMDQRPLFILGATRCGTSAVAHALASTGVFWGHKEGHILDLNAYLADSLRAFYDQKQREGAINGATFLSMVPKGFFYQGLDHLFVELVRATVPSRRWFDKTPSCNMIRLAPRFLAMWPNARFVFLKRRALEFIESRRRKFPEVSFETHCREWTAAMTAWEGVRAQLKGRILEIDQVYMVRRPEAVAATVAALVDLDVEAQSKFAESLTNDRPEQTEDVFGRLLTFAELDWSDEERAIFECLCAPVMARFGYAWDETYRVADGPHSWLMSDGLKNIRRRLAWRENTAYAPTEAR